MGVIIEGYGDPAGFGDNSAVSNSVIGIAKHASFWIGDGCQAIEGIVLIVRDMPICIGDCYLITRAIVFPYRAPSEGISDLYEADAEAREVARGVTA